MLHKSRFFTRPNSVGMAIGLAFAVMASSQVAAHDHGGMPRRPRQTMRGSILFSRLMARC